VLGDIHGKSARKLLDRLTANEPLEREDVLKLIHKSLYPKLEDITSAVESLTTPLQRALLRQILDHIDDLNRRVEVLDEMVEQYMDEEISSPWWSAVMGLPFKLLAALKSSEPEDAGHKLNTFQLTKEESKLVEALNQRISASVDQKTSVVSISVNMQDPLVSAVLADTVVSRLQEFITEYRTNKARKDLEYAETLNEEAQQEYYKAQQRYADYLDRNQGIVLHSAQITRDRLENEATLAFNLYNQTAQQVQKAKAKVQETTPVYAVVTPATVPVKPSSPRKFMILVGFTFLAFVACAAWILFGAPLLAERKAGKGEKKDNLESDK
ncbi:MAG: hypothetical protein K2O49_01380, partial [Muribaculaceae bacterium]|nr:hypothetical protein [Muribaculaceae bacterium]